MAPVGEAEENSALTGRAEAAMLFVLVLLAAAFFVLTSFIVRAYRSYETRLGRQWFNDGQRRLMAQPDEAALAFQTALRFDSNAVEYRYALVEALLRSGRTEQAYSYLLALWDKQPANGWVNLQLGRIAADRHDLGLATEYFRSAIYGVWNDAPQERRQEARLELARLLLQHGLKREAATQLVAVQTDGAVSMTRQRELAFLLLQAGDLQTASTQFQSALKSSPGDPELLAGSGQVAFALGQYRSARSYLEEARRHGDSSPEVEKLLHSAELVVNNDPFDRTVAWEVRARRALGALAQARGRAESCAQQGRKDESVAQMELVGILHQIENSEKRASVAKLHHDPDLLISTAGLAFRAEEAAAKLCGQAEGLDAALLLIGRSHGDLSR